jgi:hypothetical protein
MSSSSSSSAAAVRTTSAGYESDTEVAIVDSPESVSRRTRSKAAGGDPDADGRAQSRYWFGTVNGDISGFRSPDSGWALFQDVFPPIAGGVYQIEKASSEHVQFCFHTINKYRLAVMRNKARSKKMHAFIEPSISWPASVRYCSKSDTRVSPPCFFGDVTSSTVSKPTTQGKRTDLEAVASLIDTGVSIKDVAIAHPKSFIQYHGGILKYLTTTRDDAIRDFKTHVSVFWGVSGSGKSRRAWAEARARGSVYELPEAKDANVIWWPGYSGQQTVILDDYYGWYPFQSFLKLLDRYPLKVRTTGDNYVEFISTHIIITSNSKPESWYAKAFMREGHWRAAFLRRLDHVSEFNEAVESAAADSPNSDVSHSRVPPLPQEVDLPFADPWVI